MDLPTIFRVVLVTFGVCFRFDLTFLSSWPKMKVQLIAAKDAKKGLNLLKNSRFCCTKVGGLSGSVV